MARRPELRREEVLSREQLADLARNLSLLGEHSVREFYQSAYRECAIVNSSTFPSARAIQQLVQAWKQLRRWRR
jgi:hypothetical protein